MHFLCFRVEKGAPWGTTDVQVVRSSKLVLLALVWKMKRGTRDSQRGEGKIEKEKRAVLYRACVVKKTRAASTVTHTLQRTLYERRRLQRTAQSTWVRRMRTLGVRCGDQII